MVELKHLMGNICQADGLGGVGGRTEWRLYAFQAIKQCEAESEA